MLCLKKKKKKIGGADAIAWGLHKKQNNKSIYRHSLGCSNGLLQRSFTRKNKRALEESNIIHNPQINFFLNGAAFHVASTVIQV